MTSELIVSTILISLALIFYSIGVWSERLMGILKPWHLVFFVLGLICDTWGTGLMLEMAGGLTFDIHGISGLIAIILMFIHAAWALVVLIRKDEIAIKEKGVKEVFHPYSPLDEVVERVKAIALEGREKRRKRSE